MGAAEAEGLEGVMMECPMMVNHLWVLQQNTHMAMTMLHQVHVTCDYSKMSKFGLAAQCLQHCS